jgi:hypothetical protein
MMTTAWVGARRGVHAAAVVRAATGAAAADKSGKRAAAGAKAELRQDDSKYRSMLSVLYPKDARPQGKLPAPADPAERERRAVLAKMWSRYAVRQAHVHGKEIHDFIRARRDARAVLAEVYPEALAAADARNAADADVPFPVDRRLPTTTPPLPPTPPRR